MVLQQPNEGKSRPMSFSFKPLYEHWNIWSSTFDRKTNCHDHVSNLCKKLSAKISVTAILISQLDYYPLIWMSHNKSTAYMSDQFG